MYKKIKLALDENLHLQICAQCRKLHLQKSVRCRFAHFVHRRFLHICTFVEFAFSHLQNCDLCFANMSRKLRTCKLFLQTCANM